MARESYGQAAARLAGVVWELGYTSNTSLLVRWLRQGRAEGDHPITPAAPLLTEPENPRPKETAQLEKIATA